MSPTPIAIIPARGGSKRIPDKNIRAFRGRPLIHHTIRAALDAELFDRVIVTTDDQEIAAIAEDGGAEVPFLRDANLADDHTPISAATVDALERVDPEGTTYTHVAQLMANCPLRTRDDILDSFDRFVERGSPNQLSVFEYGWQNPWWAMQIGDAGTLDPLFPEMFDENVRSQDQPPLYCITGAIWWAQCDALRSARTFHMDERFAHPMPWQRAVDVDTEDDWQFAEVLAETLDAAEAPPSTPTDAEA
jgi:N-acylneuraminate cytidylyltransferase